MDDKVQGTGINGSNHHGQGGGDRAPELVRSRWTPKPEQILILESIFNSGMVNPPRDETVRIRKILEKFGAVGDANVFYWFQNRRSRSRRRQRQLQAGHMADPRAAMAGTTCGQLGAGAILYEPASSSSSSSNSSNNSCGGGLFPCSSSSSSSSSSFQGFVGDDNADDLFSIPGQMSFLDNTQTSPFLCSTDVSHYQPGIITVFINGIASEVPSCSINLSAMFGPDVMLVHSSGQILPVNEYGILLQTLQMGESYFLVSATG